jgi:hypothetical protein
MPFWIFFKIEIGPADPVKTRWPGQNPVTRSKPGTRVLDRVGFKNYGPKGLLITITWLAQADCEE